MPPRAPRPPKTARTPRPAGTSSGAPQTSPVLIISLVFSLLIALTLGVFLYLAQEKIRNADDRAKQQAEEARAKNELYEQYRDYYLAAARSWIEPTSLSEAERQSLVEVERKMNDQASGGNDPRPKEFLALKRQIEGDPTAADPVARAGLIGPKDPATGKTATTLREKVQSLEKLVVETNKKAKDIEDQLAKTIADFETYKQQWNAKVTEDRLAKLRTEMTADMNKKLAEKDAVIASQKEQHAALTRELEKALADNRTEFENAKKRLEEAFAKAEATRAEEQRLFTEKTRIKNMVALDQPRGRITRVEGGGDTVFLDIGSDQRLNPQQTFSVYGVGPGGKALALPKAKIEVVQVLGPRVSRARVTAFAKPDFARTGVDPDSPDFWITEPAQFSRVRDLILPGDLIYNPLWDPREKVRVALAGVFDLDGDGMDDLDTFRRILRDNGAEVDAYLDPASNYQIKGAITNQTRFLILGNQTGRGLTAGLGQAAEGAGQAGSVLDNVAKLTEEAQKKGVEVVQLRAFLARMGFNSLRVPSTRPGAEALPPGATPAKKDNGKDAEKPEKKDEGK